MNLLKNIFIFTLFLTLASALNPVFSMQSSNYSSQVEKDYRYGKNLANNKKYKSAIKYLKAAARKGHEKAQYHLGIVYYQQKQYQKARYWLRKSSNNGNADAQFHYANTYRFALGTKEQTTIARRLYQKAAKQGHPQAQFELAKMFQNGIGAKKNPELARKWYEKSAKNGYKYAKQALNTLAPATQNKQANKATSNQALDKSKLEKSIVQAEPSAPNKSETLLENAFKGDPEQQYQLAMRYLQGYELGPDDGQAIYWLTQAAKKQHPLAEYQLGNQYFTGQYVTQNIAQAVRYFHRAEEKGVLAAKTALTVIGSYGYENLVKAELGEKRAQFEMALEYLSKSSSLDKTIALEWLQASAEQSYGPALFKLGKMYESGEIVEKNQQKAFDAYLEAAKLNNPDAQYAVSKMYKNGIGVEKNQTLANTWLNRAADMGVEAAQKALQFSEL